MKFLIAVCSVLLALIFLYQVRILGQLEGIAARPPAIIPAPQAPSAAAIASELRKQMAREAFLSGPALFAITVGGGGQMFPDSKPPGRLTHATLNIVRDGGIATNLALKAPQGIASQMEKIGSGEDGDHFRVSFKPDSANFLPDSWIFGLTYVAQDHKPQERSYTVTYHPALSTSAPLNLEVRESSE